MRKASTPHTGAFSPAGHWHSFCMTVNDMIAAFSPTLLAQGSQPSEEESGSEALPDSLDEIKETLLETLGGVWVDFVGHIPFLVAGLVALLFTWLAAGIAGSIAQRSLRGRKRMRKSLKQLFQRFIVIVVWLVGLMLTAMIIFPGLTPAKALGGLGLLSVAIGFAFKDIFENFFAGILLLWRFAFEDGDFIKCGDVDGRVEKVEIRNTIIRRSTGELVVIPNASLFKNAVEVVTSKPKRRIHLTTGIGYDENVSEALPIIEKAVASCETVDGSQPIDVFPEAFGSSSIDSDVSWWTDSSPREGRRSCGEVVTAIKKALDDAGIEIPFPYRTLTFKGPLPEEIGKS